MTGLTQTQKQLRGNIPSTKWTTQADGVASPIALHLILYNKEANKSLNVSQMAANQFLQIKTTLQYIHMEGRIFLPDVEKGGRRGLCEVEDYLRGSSYMG